MAQHNTLAYLVNTGWVGGAYGVGSRMDLPQTRKIIDAILDGSIETAEFDTMAIFNLEIPNALPGVDTNLLNPRNAWQDKDAYDKAAGKLADMFANNFKRFIHTPQGKELQTAGPQPVPELQ